MFVGGKDLNTNKGVIIVLCGDKLNNLDYSFTIGSFYELGDMAECPSWYRQDGQDIILVSGCNVPQRGNDFNNIHCSVAIVGNLNFDKGTFDVQFIKELDKGDCFYAPQLINNADNAIMIGWQEMWCKPYPTQQLGHGWAGSFNIPRKLTVKDGELYTTPVDSLQRYAKPYSGKDIPQSSIVDLLFEGDSKLTIGNDNGSVIVGMEQGRVYLDSTASNNGNGCVRYTNNQYKTCNVRVLLDVSGIEVFVDNGREVISSRMYIEGKLVPTVQGKAKIVAVNKVQL